MFAYPRPSGRRASEFLAIWGVGELALETRISWPVKVMSTARWRRSTSNVPCSVWNLIRLSESRLHAVSSRKTNSEHGLVALIRPVFGTTFQSWIVLSNWRPGSPQIHAASAISRHMSRALYVSTVRPSTTAFVFHSLSSITARMKSSLTRTEWLAFWNWTESYAPPGTLKPAL